MTNAHCYELSAAIDFGTTYSGIAYSYLSEKDKIHVISHWSDGTVMTKVPTAILFDRNKNFVAFGQEAVNTYSEFADEEEEKDYYYFHRFKMILYNRKNIAKDMNLTDANGKSMNAMKVFSSAIEFMKDFLIDSINERNTQNNMNVASFRWVLTVPAIWSDSAKQFMREAAEMAGIPPRHLLFALEPEAASIYCRKAPKEKLVSTDDFKRTEAKYLILDNGGGTIDITAHQIMENDCIKEIYKATGGTWGGTKVDEAFIDYLATLFTNQNVLKVQNKHPSYWIQLLQDFEGIKKKVTSKSSETTVSLAAPLDIWNKKYFLSLSNEASKGALMKGSRLKITKDVVKDMIANVSNNIKQHVDTLLKLEEIKGLNFIIMVGGFSNSSILVNDIKDLVGKNIPIVVPEEAELAVVKGAVLFGWRPDIVKIRKSKKTYGISKMKKFVEGVDPPGQAFIDDDDVKQCKNVFDTLVIVNEDIPINKIVTRIYNPVRKKSIMMNVPLLMSSNATVQYTNDYGVEPIGTLQVPMPDTKAGMERRVIIDVVFGNTEFRVTAKDETTGKSVKAIFDFLT